MINQSMSDFPSSSAPFTPQFHCLLNRWPSKRHWGGLGARVPFAVGGCLSFSTYWCSAHLAQSHTGHGSSSRLRPMRRSESLELSVRGLVRTAGVCPACWTNQDISSGFHHVEEHCRPLWVPPSTIHISYIHIPGSGRWFKHVRCEHSFVHGHFFLKPSGVLLRLKCKMCGYYVYL